MTTESFLAQEARSLQGTPATVDFSMTIRGNMGANVKAGVAAFMALAALIVF
jgi:hypothetical protein